MFDREDEHQVVGGQAWPGFLRKTHLDRPVGPISGCRLSRHAGCGRKAHEPEVRLFEEDFAVHLFARQIARRLQKRAGH